ncbi:MAG: glycosyltransferase family 4 protein [Bacteroidales bacterium]|nr:glycosyltransferase family 4 protein [Bacteroidales bacterium]
MKNPNFNKLGYNGFAYTKYNIFFKIFYFLKIYDYTKALTDFLKNNKQNILDYSLIHAHNLFVDSAIAYKISQKYKIKYITAVRNADLKYLKYMPFLYFFGKKILNKSERIICISPSIKQKIIKKYHKIPDLTNKIIVIPNGIDDAFLNNKPNKISTPQVPIKLLYVGSFLKQKNIHQIIKLVNKKNKLLKLTLIGGGGNYEKKIFKLIKSSTGIAYRGKINSKIELTKIFRKSDIFIMPSVNETFGLVYAEAMSQGLPIIYSLNTGFDNFFTDGTVGYPVNSNDINDYLNKINLIIKNYDKIAKNCIAKSKLFNWHDIAKKYINIYQNLI